MLVVGAIATTGCNQAELKKALADAKAAEAQKDSLLTEVLETTQFVTDVNSELAKAKTLAVTTTSSDPGLPGARKDREDRKAALERVQAVIAKLNESEAKLTETETRAKTSRQRNARLLAQIETYKKTIEDLRTTAEAQKTEYEAQLAAANTQIATLAGRVDTLSTEKGQLESDKAALTDTVVNLTAYKNTVYYAIGTKDELMKKGIITKEGSKFLVFGGTRLEPARNLSPDHFTAIDKTQQKSIPLPRTDKKYKIVSRQSPTYLGGGVSKDGKVSGTVEIAQPEEFWSASKYLILVQDCARARKGVGDGGAGPCGSGATWALQAGQRGCGQCVKIANL
jgi:myosin heavy subunit